MLGKTITMQTYGKLSFNFYHFKIHSYCFTALSELKDIFVAGVCSFYVQFSVPNPEQHLHNGYQHG